MGRRIETVRGCSGIMGRPISDDGRHFTVGAASLRMSPFLDRLLEFDGRKSGDYTDGNLATIASTKRSRFNLQAALVEDRGLS
ncbi:MAG: hypothetical protein Ct9H90mP16_20700 [Candidatus Poseidoniales archaeon]|nr:MAG: hypothetical protein Ct9H90mP16_20700 [Candidatus Poseidoniales archaeon]